MKRNKRRKNIIIILLLIPLVVLCREALIVVIILFGAKIIYNIIKLVSVTKEDETRIKYVGDIVQLEETEDDYKDSTRKSEKYKISYVGDRVKLDEELREEYKKYLEDENVQKGIKAERKIIKILNRIFLEKNIIHDSYFYCDKNDTTQVDIIAIDTTGIYVIESKAYSSIIKGKETDKNWVQLFSNKKYQIFKNPIMQNEWHIKAIKACLKEYGIPDKAFKSYIVFSNECKLDLELSCDCNVMQQRYLFYAILKDREITQEILKEKQVEDIAKILREHADVDEKVKINHVLRRKNSKKYMKKRG